MSNEQPHRDGRTWWQRLVCLVRTRTLAGANVFREHDESSNRAALRRELDDAEIPVGLLAYVNDQPAGWTRVVPRRTLAGSVATERSSASLTTTTLHGGSPASRSVKSTAGSVSEERCSARPSPTGWHQRSTLTVAADRQPSAMSSDAPNELAAPLIMVVILVAETATWYELAGD